MGPRRLPARQRDRRPGSLKITSSCAATGCGAVTLTAFRRPRRHAAPAAWQSPRQLAGNPARQSDRCRRGVKYGVAKPQAPTQPRMLAPFHPQGVCANLQAFFMPAVRAGVLKC